MATQLDDTPALSIDPATRVGELSLTVADLDHSIAFYTEAMGFSLLEHTGSSAVLGSGTAPLVNMVEYPGASSFPGNATGLFHFAILLPSRPDLGRWLRHWLALGYPLPGQGDHLVSEALYLSDPDGNGIEVYHDRPRSEWPMVDGKVRMASDPVDIRGLLMDAESSGQTWSGLPAGTTLGHMHLQVGDISQATAFYHGVLGFDIVAAMPSALFVSAGGYHHHIGANIWNSRGAAPAPEGTAGLRHFTIVLPTAEARADTVRRLTSHGYDVEDTPLGVAIDDPWRNRIYLQIEPV